MDRVLGYRFKFSIFAVLFVVLFQTGLANALSPAQQSIFQENIHYFDISGGSSCGSSTTTASGSGTVEAFTLDQVKTFASEPVTSTWNIANSTVEQWFLKQANAQATISKYGLDSSNIGDITSAVQAAGVSPAFFYLYTVNEGGGAGGFINHYPQTPGYDSPGDGPAAATRDAQYIASQAQQMNGKPSTGGGEPADMPTAEAQQILQAMPSGSIGTVYIQATAAVTAELEDLSGKTGDWSGAFNTPLSDAMQNITTMGGDPLQGGATVSAAGCASVSDTTDTCSATKPFGGVSATQDSPQYTQTQLVQLFGDPGTAASHPQMDANLTTVDFNGHSVQVNKKAAGCLEAVANEIASENINYTINEMGCYRFDSDNGTSNIGLASYHTYGVACDINPSTNPFSESGANLPHDMPQAYIQAFYDHGWSWGGNWSQPKDFMHFEFNGIDPSGS